MTIRSTDEVPSRGFAAHGWASFRQEGRWLVCDTEGPFNLELVQALREPVLAAAAPLIAAGARWGLLCRFRRNALASPEALSAFTAFLAALRREGRAPMASAYVLGDEVEGGTLMAPRLQRCFEAAGLAFASFAQEDAARAWLQERLP